MKKLILAAAVICAGCGVEPITEEEAVDILAALTQLADEAACAATVTPFPLCLQRQPGSRPASPPPPTRGTRATRSTRG